MTSADYVQQGDTVDFTPETDLPAGSVVVQGDLVGITKHDILANRLGSICVEGVFDFNKDLTQAISAGARVYWDATNNQVVTIATGNKLLGKCVQNAPVDTATARVRLSQ